uniref:uncharacterized protein LOC109952198 n=1 Tax=Monopterus albus TaxID=43700 RepID=UPI0009B31C12|nr:uncharacterized protein LOC109952198 [Monopterus albus]
MTHPIDDFPSAQPKSCQGIHTQESGDAGFSSDMKHKLIDYYNENTSVRPIPKEESYISETGMAGNGVMSVPLAEESFTGYAKPESHSVSAEGGLLKPSTVVVTQEDNFPQQATPIARSKKGLEEEVATALTGTTTITEVRPDVEGIAEGGCIINTDMNKVGNAEEIKGPGEMRNRNRPRKRDAGNRWKVCFSCLVAFTLFATICEGLPDKCFTCLDKEKCQKINAIHGLNDEHLYYREPGQAFPECCAVSSSNHSCTVCIIQANITIICPEAVGTLEVEDVDSNLLSISPFCEQKQLCSGAIRSMGHPHYGGICSLALFLIVGRALVV